MSPRHQHHKQSTNFAKRRRARVVLICGLIVICVFSVGFSVVLFMSLDAFSIDTVNIAGVDAGAVSTLKAAVLESLQGKYFGLFPRSNTFISPDEAIKGRIRALEPSADAVKISHTGGTTIDVTVNERDPSAIVCTDYPDFSGTDRENKVDDSCYYADLDGYIFKKAPSITGYAYHRYYVPTLVDNESSTTDVIGMYATSTSEFTTLQKFYTNVTNGGIVVDAILIKDNGEYELYIENVSLGGASSADSGNQVVVVYFNNARNFNYELANLLSFWSTMKGPLRSKATTTTFDYIDVRYGANVFYK